MLFWTAYFHSKVRLQHLKKGEKQELKMGKSMYNFGNRDKERARQQKQIDKAAKRIMAKQQKANMKTQTPNADSGITEQEVVDPIVQSMPQIERTDKRSGS